MKNKMVLRVELVSVGTTFLGENEEHLKMLEVLNGRKDIKQIAQAVIHVHAEDVDYTVNQYDVLADPDSDVEVDLWLTFKKLKWGAFCSIQWIKPEVWPRALDFVEVQEND